MSYKNENIYMKNGFVQFIHNINEETRCVFRLCTYTILEIIKTQKFNVPAQLERKAVDRHQ